MMAISLISHTGQLVNQIISIVLKIMQPFTPVLERGVTIKMILQNMVGKRELSFAYSSLISKNVEKTDTNMLEMALLVAGCRDISRNPLSRGGLGQDLHIFRTFFSI